MLTFMDRADVDRVIRDKVNSGGGASYLGPNIYIGSFICPDDRNHIDVIGGLSYVANTGYISAETFTKTSNSTYGGIGRSHRPKGQFNDEKYKKNAQQDDARMKEISANTANLKASVRTAQGVAA